MLTSKHSASEYSKRSLRTHEARTADHFNLQFPNIFMPCTQHDRQGELRVTQNDCKLY